MAVSSGIVFRPLCSPKLQSLFSPVVTHSRLSYSYSYSTTTTTTPSLIGGLFTSHRYGNGDWIHSRRLGVGGGVYASQRGFRKVRGRPTSAARKKQQKGKELELDVKICIEQQLPDDPEILVTFYSFHSLVV